MTNEEAIKILKANVMVACDTSDKVGYDTPLNKAIEQALEMAIKALEQETVPREHYEHEYFLRKELDFKVARLEKQIAEQEPCEDAISRKAMVDYQQYLHGKMSNEENHKLWEFIKNLPSVTPTRKKGGWIKQYTAFINDDNQIVTECHCNNCYGISYFRSMNGELVGAKYCPNCGAEMENVENDK